MMDGFPQTFGRYQLNEPLALGGMAELFLAETIGAHGISKTVVVKRILPHLLADERYRSMFINEAIVTAQLTHPKIAQTYEHGIEDDQLFIVMEYIDGVDGLALLRENAKRKTKIPEELAVYIMTEVLDALDFAHGLTDASGAPQGIVHRDVSPSNILLSRRGDVKLVDFGVASTASQGKNAPGEVLRGKYGYMSPQQVLSEELNPRSDVFSAGVVLAEMLMGKRLFVGSNEVDVLVMVRDANLERLEEMRHLIEPDLNSIVHKALRKKEGDRYQSAVEFRDALQEWLFEKRHRVTNTQLAKLVESFYTIAVAKRKKSLEAELKLPGSQVGAMLPADGKEEEEYSDFQVEVTAPGADEVAIAAGTQAPSAVIADSLENTGDPLHAKDDRVAIAARNKFSAAFPSIRMMDADPASRDFDDSSIAGVVPRPSNVSLSKVAKPTDRSEPAPDLASTASSLNTFAETSALGALIQLTREGQSGKLMVSRGNRCKEAFLKAGAPVAVMSNDPSDLFGNFLVKEKCISWGDLRMALAVMPRFNGQLGDTLVGLGLMEPLDVFAALTSQIRRRLVDVCTWTEGSFEWFNEESCPEPVFQLDLEPFQAYGAGAIATPRESIESWLVQRGHLRPTINPSNTFSPEHFKVGPGARNYLDSTDGSKTVQDIVAASSPDDEGLHELQMLFLLLNAGLLKDAAA